MPCGASMGLARRPRARRRDRPPTTTATMRNAPRPGAEPVRRIRLGQSVRHDKFGEGVILNFDGDGERTRVEVRFTHAGTSG